VSKTLEEDFSALHALPYHLDNSKIDSVLLEYLLRNNLIDAYTCFQKELHKSVPQEKF